METFRGEGGGDDLRLQPQAAREVEGVVAAVVGRGQVGVGQEAGHLFGLAEVVDRLPRLRADPADEREHGPRPAERLELRAPAFGRTVQPPHVERPLAEGLFRLAGCVPAPQPLATAPIPVGDVGLEHVEDRALHVARDVRGEDGRETQAGGSHAGRRRRAELTQVGCERAHVLVGEPKARHEWIDRSTGRIDTLAERPRQAPLIVGRAFALRVRAEEQWPRERGRDPAALDRAHATAAVTALAGGLRAEHGHIALHHGGRGFAGREPTLAIETPARHHEVVRGPLLGRCPARDSHRQRPRGQPGPQEGCRAHELSRAAIAPRRRAQPRCRAPRGAPNPCRQTGAGA